MAIFGPEHGFRGTGQAGNSEGKTTDPRTGITVYDTYTWTMYVAMHAAVLTDADRLRTMIDAGASSDEVTGAWSAELAAFRKDRKPYLLYR